MKGFVRSTRLARFDAEVAAGLFFEYDLIMVDWSKSGKGLRNLTKSGSFRPGQLLSFFYHLPNFIKLYWSLFWDKRAPILPKIVLVLAIVYFICPLDLVVDFSIPGLGYVDDLAILILASRYFIKAMPKKLVAEKVEAIDGKAE